METQKMRISRLIDDLQKVYTELREGKIEIKVAQELHNNAGKTAKLISIKLDYNKWTKNKEKIEFLEK